MLLMLRSRSRSATTTVIVVGAVERATSMPRASLEVPLYSPVLGSWSGV